MASFAFLSLLVVSSFDATSARRYFRPSLSTFRHINFTFNVNAECVPFEDPHCCIDRPVCECRNGGLPGTFFSMNPIRINGTSSICGPPGNETLGDDATGIPGWCC
ncbi:uncharacterized protein GGS25DRAFT_501534 [Hypoxylon fragiforme]|uniref:uncharacterized protein n=1 Tax=Hypoxylon fragiforme TaxID=63214 RepID=UPI0020C71A90|nr:uncharacterized protein GGS25DRAFT_501534 [Hypoxylon fragiforme]KAI2606496.1 hypothetical protein GGS25DRAFT_501534 [Hypoxylon fragiforme]